MFAELIEATTWDNEANLAKDFLDSLKVLEKTKPELYRQYVMNDWSVSAEQRVFFTPALLDSLRSRVVYDKPLRRLLAGDPATGGDRCVLFVMENGTVKEELILHTNDTMKIAGEAMVLMEKYQLLRYAGDAIGIGKGLCDRLSELGKEVLAIQSAEAADDREQFANRRAEMWWYAMRQAQMREIEYPTDEETRVELCAVRYKVVNSNGKVICEPKDETKKRLGRSPDKADAFIYGLWGLKDAPIVNERSVPLDFSNLVSAGRGGW